MIKRRRFPKIFFGWWTVLGGGTLGFWVGAYAAYGFSALLKPIASELGLNRAVTSFAASIARIDGGLEAPAAGWATDRFGPRGVIFLGILVVGISLILMNFINSLWSFYLVWGVLLATGHNMSTRVPLDTAISNWFVKKRGLAVGIKWVIMGLSGAVGLPIVAWLVVNQGWR
ncbi:MFS transporter, partial [Chloroflexota bacterium]